jgi:hypothetical protein
MLPLLAYAETPPHVWHIGWSEGDSALRPTVQFADENGDGKPERRTALASIGSGWKTFTDCVRDGATGHEACRLEHSTAYAWFGAEELSLSPATGNQARNLLPPSKPVPHAAPDDPRQAAMWALSRIDDAGRVRPLGWHAGRPVGQTSARMSVATAKRFKGGMAWDPSGNLPDKTAARTTVIWSAGWPQWNGENPGAHTPKRVLQTPQYEVFQHGHALAVYVVQRKQHAWVFHQPSTNGYKLDRWGAIKKVTLEGKTLVVQLAQPVRAEPVRIALP